MTTITRCSRWRRLRGYMLQGLTSNKEYTDSVTGKSLDRDEVDAARKGDGVRPCLVATEINTYERTDVFATTISRAATGKGARRRRVATYDVSVAFFHGEAGDDIFVVPPKEIRGECPLWRLCKALYGTRDAGEIFQDYVARKLTEAGFDALLDLPCARACFTIRRRRYGWATGL
eukprot:1012563-Amphidinium_carterae.3